MNKICLLKISLVLRDCFAVDLVLICRLYVQWEQRALSRKLGKCIRHLSFIHFKVEEREEENICKQVERTDHGGADCDISSDHGHYLCDHEGLDGP